MALRDLALVPSRKPFLNFLATIFRCLILPVPVVWRRLAFSPQLSTENKRGELQIEHTNKLTYSALVWRWGIHTGHSVFSECGRPFCHICGTSCASYCAAFRTKTFLSSTTLKERNKNNVHYSNITILTMKYKQPATYTRITKHSPSSSFTPPSKVGACV